MMALTLEFRAASLGVRDSTKKLDDVNPAVPVCTRLADLRLVLPFTWGIRLRPLPLELKKLEPVEERPPSGWRIDF